MRKPGEEEGRACKRQARREAGHAKGRTEGRQGIREAGQRRQGMRKAEQEGGMGHMA